MIVVQIMGGANDWRGGRLMALVELETEGVKCSECGRPIGRGARAFYLSDPPKPVRIAHPNGKCR